MSPLTSSRPAERPPRKLFPAPEVQISSRIFQRIDQGSLAPVTSTILEASSFVQYASIHFPPPSRVSTYAPRAPHLMITAFFAPSSKNCWAASSTVNLAIGWTMGMERSDRASSAFGLKSDALRITSIRLACTAHLKISMEGNTIANDGSSSGTQLY